MAEHMESSISPGGLLDLSNKAIDDLGDIHDLNRPNMKSLYLYHNRITKIENLNCGMLLVELNLAANFITEISGLECLVNLRNLDLSLNDICKIENLDQLVCLRELDLSGNLINKIEGLGNLVELKILNLSKNKIQSIQNLCNLTELKKLNLGSNQITNWDYLPELENLTHLDLSGNGLTALDQSPKLPALIKLKLQDNMINVLNLPFKTYPGYEDLKNYRENCWDNLQELWLSNNLIKDRTCLKPLQGLEQLRSIYLRDNPFVCGEKAQVMYILWISTLLPKVTSIDGYNIPK